MYPHVHGHTHRCCDCWFPYCYICELFDPMVTRPKSTAWFPSLFSLKDLQFHPIALRIKCDSFAQYFEFSVSFKGTSSSLSVAPTGHSRRKRPPFLIEPFLVWSRHVSPCPLLSFQHNQSNVQVHLQHRIPNSPSPVSTATSLNQAILKSNLDDLFKSL